MYNSFIVIGEPVHLRPNSARNRPSGPADIADHADDLNWFLACDQVSSNRVTARQILLRQLLIDQDPGWLGVCIRLRKAPPRQQRRAHSLQIISRNMPVFSINSWLVRRSRQPVGIKVAAQVPVYGWRRIDLSRCAHPRQRFDSLLYVSEEIQNPRLTAAPGQVQSKSQNMIRLKPKRRLHQIPKRFRQ